MRGSDQRPIVTIATKCWHSICEWVAEQFRLLLALKIRSLFWHIRLCH